MSKRIFCDGRFNKCEFSEYQKCRTVRSAPHDEHRSSIKRGTSLRTFLIAYEENEDLYKMGSKTS